MQPMKPAQELFILPEGTRYKGDVNTPGRTCRDLPMLIIPDGRMVCQWMPDENDLELLKNGVPVTIVLHTGGSFVINPMEVCIGGMDLRR